MSERDGSGHLGASSGSEGGIGEMTAKVFTLLVGIIAFLLFLRLPQVVQDYFPASTFKNVLVELLHEDGLLVIATILFSAGVGYLFFRGPIGRFVSKRSDLFTTEVIGSVNRGYDKVSESVARRVGTVDADLVLRWISEGRGTSEEYKNSAFAAAKRYFAPERGIENAYVDAVLEQFLNGWLNVGYWRRGMFANIHLEKLEKSELAGQKLITWEETQSFTVICPAGRGTYSIPQEIGIEARPEDLAHMLKIIEFSIKAGPAGEEPAVLLDLADVLSNIDVKALEGGKPCEKKVDDKRSVKFEFRQNFLTIKIDTKVDLRATQTTITARQVCPLKGSDRLYYFVNPLPTDGFTFAMRLGASLQDTVFSDVTVTAESYHSKAAINVKHTTSERNAIIRTVDGWFLPGSAIIVSWTNA
jgi:hypothetical protein